VTLGGKPLFLFENGEISLFNDLSIKKVSFPFSPRRSGLAFVEARPENRKLTWLKSWFDALLYIQIDPKRMGARAEKEAVHPTKTLENFAEWYRHLRLERGSAMEAMRRSLTEVIDGFESLDLKDAGLNTRVLQVAARLDGKSVAYGFDELSDGQRALIGLYALLHCSPGHQSLVCIDEPDNFIALAEIQPWLSELQDAEETGLQVMIASHHPELLNQLATRNGIVLERIDGRQTIARPFAPDDDSTLTPAELVARGWELA
jgi:predicted ATPase